MKTVPDDYKPRTMSNKWRPVWQVAEQTGLRPDWVCFLAAWSPGLEYLPWLDSMRIKLVAERHAGRTIELPALSAISDATLAKAAVAAEVIRKVLATETPETSGKACACGGDHEAPEAPADREPDKTSADRPGGLSETDYGAMVGAIDLFLQQHGEATVLQLSRLVEVSKSQIVVYVSSAGHLCRCWSIVRFATAADNSRSARDADIEAGAPPQRPAGGWRLMICPNCGHDHDCAWPKFGRCAKCEEDMSAMVAEAEREWAADDRRRDKERK